MKIAVLAIPLLLAAACTASDSMVQTRQKAKQGIRLERTSDCIPQSAISGFEVLDDRNVVLFGTRNRKAYLVQIASACFDISQQIALVTVDGDQNGQICGFGRDSIAYERFGRRESCRVMGIEELSDERRIRVMERK
ncbi:MAG: DUF6491 family protein [Steroidobacteraceae bacterium]